MIYFALFCYSEYVSFFGAEAGFNYLFFIGLGITAYGFCYLIHDVLIKDSNGLSLQKTDTS
jgi:beta-carotene 3-hydroxylase